MIAESTNDRVASFFFLTFGTLISLGIWQILHLRSYFKKSAFSQFSKREYETDFLAFSRVFD